MVRQNPHEKNRFFRLSFIEDDTHKVKWTLRFRQRGFILMAATALLILIALGFSIIAFTPIRTLIPGYPDANSKKAAVANAIRIDSLENSITRWQFYAENITRVLSGESTDVLDSLLIAGTTDIISDKSREKLAERDSLLRATIMKEEQFQVSSGTERKLPIEGMHFFSPLKGVVTKAFDRALHPGLDITAPVNSVVSSIYDGTVIYSGWDESRGNVIIIQHSSDLVSIYQHNQKLLRKIGDSVKAGTSVALLGSSGSVNRSDYLHFEMWYLGEPVDPAKYILF